MRYEFPDGISAKESVEAMPEVKLSTFVEATKMERAYREEKKEVADAFNRIRNAAVSQATPWTKRLTKEMVDKLSEAEKVSAFMNCIELVFMHHGRS
jgi:hypothetical protein